MYHLGYILYDVHPALKTITEDQIAEADDKPVLIVGFSNAYNLYPHINIDNKTIDKDKRIYFCFSKEEAPEKYQEYIDNFITHCFENFSKQYQVNKCKDAQEIKTDVAFIYETPSILTISTLERGIYYFNKEISTFFNPSFKQQVFSLLKADVVISWDRYEYFGAYLRCVNEYATKESVLNLLQPYGDVELYLGQYCLEWVIKNVDKINREELQTWLRAYDIESKLSTIKIKVDTDRVKYIASDSENKIANNIYEAIHEDYIVQRYNGTDKVTGRIYPKDDGYSLQSLHKDYRDIVIAENGCVIGEFDYKYFEYSLLTQICGIHFEGDPHKHLAIELFGDESFRPICKDINYGILYGKSIDKTVDEIIKNYPIQLTKKELKEKLQDFIKPIAEFETKLQEEYEANNKVIYNYFKRSIRPTKKYACLNNYIQSTAADYMILKLEKLFSYLKDSNRIILQVHDSVLLNLSINDINNTELLEDIQTILTSEEKGLTAQVDFKYGKNWKSLK